MRRVACNRQASVTVPKQGALLQELLHLAVSPYAQVRLTNMMSVTVVTIMTNMMTLTRDRILTLPLMQVRAKAQGAVASILVALPTCKPQVFDFIVSTLASPVEQDNEAQLSAIKGCLYLANCPAVLKLMGRRYDCLQRMMKALDAMAHVDKQSIHALVSHLSNEMRTNMEYQSLGQMPASVLDVLVALRPAARAREGEFKRGLDGFGDQQATFDEGLQAVTGYLSKWLAEPGRHWKYELIFADKLMGMTAMRPAILPNVRGGTETVGCLLPTDVALSLVTGAAPCL